MAMDIDTIATPDMELKSNVRSCTTCSKAKAKCVRQSGQSICERCARLRKECSSKEPVLRRRKIVKTTRAAQLEKLENKIEHLVNALSTTQARRGLSADYGQPSPPISQISERSSSIATRNENVLHALCEATEDEQSDSPHSCIASPTLGISHAASPADGPIKYPSLGVSIPEAELLLDRYRRLMAASMPFVLIPERMSAQQLSTEKPFLLHAIVVVTYFHDLPKQYSLVKGLMRDVSERVLMNNEKSLDILSGILVFVAWYHPHIFWCPQINNLLHIAQAMTLDLVIDRPPHQCVNFGQATQRAVSGLPFVGRTPTLEEHRVLAGTFYLTSMLSSSLKKFEPMTYSKFLDEAIIKLEQVCEFESDLFLVQMVRLQHVMQEASGTESPDAPMAMYVKAFHSDLDQLRKNDPCRDQTNVFLQMQYLSSEILVWELSLTDLQENKVKPLRSHLDDLYHLVEAIGRFINVFFSIPISDYLTMPFSAFGQFAHAFIVLIKMASLDVDGWDMRATNDKLNFLNVVDGAADRFEAATKSSPDGQLVNNDAFLKWAQRIRWMKQIYEAKYTQESADDRSEAARTTAMTEPSPQDSAISGAQQPTPPDDMLSGDFFNYLDENFWQSFAGDFDLGITEMTMG